MQIVINIPEEMYKHAQEYEIGGFNIENDAKLFTAIKNGTPLPKGHGRLIDVQDAVDNLMAYKEIGVFGNYDKLTICGCIDRLENHVKPIIEADKARRYN